MYFKIYCTSCISRTFLLALLRTSFASSKEFFLLNNIQCQQMLKILKEGIFSSQFSLLLIKLCLKWVMDLLEVLSFFTMHIIASLNASFELYLFKGIEKRTRIQYHQSFWAYTMGSKSIIEKVNRKIKLMISFQGQTKMYSISNLLSCLK